MFGDEKSTTTVFPAPIAGIGSRRRTWRKSAARSAAKFTYGPVAVAVIRRAVGRNAAAISFATAAAFCPAAKQPTAKSPSSGFGGVVTASFSAGSFPSVETSSAASRRNGERMGMRLYTLLLRGMLPLAHVAGLAVLVL